MKFSHEKYVMGTRKSVSIDIPRSATCPKGHTLSLTSYQRDAILEIAETSAVIEFDGVIVLNSRFNGCSSKLVCGAGLTVDGKKITVTKTGVVLSR